MLTHIHTHRCGVSVCECLCLCLFLHERRPFCANINRPQSKGGGQAFRGWRALTDWACQLSDKQTICQSGYVHGAYNFGAHLSPRSDLLSHQVPPQSFWPRPRVEQQEQWSPALRAPLWLYFVVVDFSLMSVSMCARD